MTEEDADDAAEGLTYAETGVDIDASEAATAALIGAAGEFEGDYAGLVDIGEQYLALATDGVGTKLLVAEAVDDYSTIGIDCMAMNVNDLIAAGVEPVAFVDYLAVEEPDDEEAEQIGAGLQEGAKRAGVALVGGETAVMPDVIRGLDIAGTCAGLAPKDAVFPGEAQAGDVLVGWPSSGIHSNGLTLAREAATRNHEYGDPFPHDESQTIAEVLLTPTRIYADVLEPLREHDANAAAHVTGGGWTNLTRMGEFQYEIDDPSTPSLSSSSSSRKATSVTKRCTGRSTWGPGSSRRYPKQLQKPPSTRPKTAGESAGFPTVTGRSGFGDWN